MRLTAALPLLLLCATIAHAQDPVFRGPKIHDGAWKTERAWSDSAAPDGSKGSYAYHYRVWAQQRADRHVQERTRLDCADLSIALLCEYAAENKLPLAWRVYYPAERRFVTFGNEDEQFRSPEDFRLWSQHFLGAMNLADNTYAITYDEWAGGDMCLMDWNQSPEAPNFEGRTVWHTYLIGKPDEIVYYGNISNGEPLPVTSVTGGSRMEMVKSHPDRYGLSPRRFSVFKGAVWGPATDKAEVIRVSQSLNLRAGPGTTHAKVGSVARGDQLTVVGRQGLWVKLIVNGEQVWAHGYYLRMLPPPAAQPEPVTGMADLIPGS